MNSKYNYSPIKKAFLLSYSITISLLENLLKLSLNIKSRIESDERTPKGNTFSRHSLLLNKRQYITVRSRYQDRTIREITKWILWAQNNNLPFL